MEKKLRTKLILQSLIFVIFLVFTIYRTYRSVVEQNTLHIFTSGVGIVISIVGIYIMLSPIFKKNKNNDFFN